MTLSVPTKIASAILAILASSASLAEVTHARSLDFTFTHAELETAEGIAAFDKRLSRFAANACRSDSAFKPPVLRKKCRQDIEEQVLSQIPNDIAESISN